AATAIRPTAGARRGWGSRFRSPCGRASFRVVHPAGGDSGCWVVCLRIIRAGTPTAAPPSKRKDTKPVEALILPASAPADHHGALMPVSAPMIGSPNQSSIPEAVSLAQL